MRCCMGKQPRVLTKKQFEILKKSPVCTVYRSGAPYRISFTVAQEIEGKGSLRLLVNSLALTSLLSHQEGQYQRDYKCLGFKANLPFLEVTGSETWHGLFAKSRKSRKPLAP